MMSTNKEYTQNNITKDECKKYFENLLKGDDEDFLVNNDFINNAKIENDIEDYIFNSDIIDEDFCKMP